MGSAFFDEVEDALELSSRRRVYEAVKKFAGGHFREIERMAQMPGGTVKYHLGYLSKHGLIKQERDGNNVRYYPSGFQAENKKLMGLLRQKTVREIILTILIHAECSHEQIARVVGVSPSTVSWHLKKLEESGVTEPRRDGRRTFYRLLVEKDDIVSLLVAYQESFLDSLVDRVIEMWG